MIYWTLIVLGAVGCGMVSGASIGMVIAGRRGAGDILSFGLLLAVASYGTLYLLGY